MTESMIERIARRIKGRVPAGYGMTDNEALEYARAAIEAMREPTDAMVDAGIDGYFDQAPDEVVTGAHNMSGIGMKQGWRAMIDAALNEQVSG